MTKTKHAPDHICAAILKVIGVFALDSNGNILAVGNTGKLDKAIEKPSNAAFANLIVGCFQGYIIGQYMAAGCPGICSRFGKHLRPDFVKFVHESRIEPKSAECNFVVSSNHCLKNILRSSRADIRFMRTFILTLCLSLALVPAISQQTVKKATVVNKKPPSAQPTPKKTAGTAAPQATKK